MTAPISKYDTNLDVFVRLAESDNYDALDVNDYLALKAVVEKLQAIVGIHPEVTPTASKVYTSVAQRLAEWETYERGSVLVSKADMENASYSANLAETSANIWKGVSKAFASSFSSAPFILVGVNSGADKKSVVYVDPTDVLNGGVIMKARYGSAITDTTANPWEYMGNANLSVWGTVGVDYSASPTPYFSVRPGSTLQDGQLGSAGDAMPEAGGAGWTTDQWLGADIHLAKQEKTWWDWDVEATHTTTVTANSAFTDSKGASVQKIELSSTSASVFTSGYYPPSGWGSGPTGQAITFTMSTSGASEQDSMLVQFLAFGGKGWVDPVVLTKGDRLLD